MTDQLREEDLFALYSETKAQAEMAAQSIAAMGGLVGELRTTIPAALRREMAEQMAQMVVSARQEMSRSVAQHQASLEQSANQVLRAAASMKNAAAQTSFYVWALRALLCMLLGIGVAAGAFYYLTRMTEAAPVSVKPPPAKVDGVPRKGK